MRSFPGREGARRGGRWTLTLFLAAIATYALGLLLTRGEAVWPGHVVPWRLPLWPFAAMALAAAYGALRLGNAVRRGACAIVAVWVILLPVWHQVGYRIVGEGISYYVFARSALFDHDLDFGNEYEAFNVDDVDPRLFSPTPAGVPRNVHAVGPAVLWAPAIAIAQAARPWIGPGRASRPVPELNWPEAVPGALEDRLRQALGRGFDHISQSAAALTTIALVLLAALLWYRELCRVVVPPAAAAGVVLAVLGTPLLWYTFFEPGMSHAPAAVLLTLAMLAWRHWRRSYSLRAAAIMGVATGVMAMQRWQLIVWALVPLTEMATRAWRSRSRGRQQRAASVASWTWQGMAFCAAVTLALVPQFVAWKLGWGSWIVNPMGSGYLRWTAPQVAPVLWSQWHGLFTWHPLTLAAAVGLVVGLRRDRWMSSVGLLVFLTMIYVNASVADWWGRESFGARRFTALFPVFAWGLAVACHAIVRRARANARVLAALLAAVLILLNCGTAYGYRWLWIERDRPVQPVQVARATGRMASDLLQRSLRELTRFAPALGARAYGWLVGEYLLSRRRLEPELRLGHETAWRFLGRGWHGPEQGRFRWIAGHRAELWLPLRNVSALDLRFEAWSIDRLPGQVVAVLVNGRLVGRRRLYPADRWYEVPLPPDALREGLNEVGFLVRRSRTASDADPRSLGAAIATVRLEPALR